MFKKFAIKDTSKYGKGVFASRDIKKGEVIRVFGGKTMGINDFVEQVNTDKEDIDDPLQVGKRTYLNLDKTSRSFNHSCDPNAALRKRSELFALQDIPKGKEITYDYSLTIAPTKWAMRCKCGSKNCRKVLGDVLSVPKTRLTEYRRLGALQEYMRRLLTQIKKDGGYKMPAYELQLLKSVKRTSNL
jgi:hypothetical protein